MIRQTVKGNSKYEIIIMEQHVDCSYQTYRMLSTMTDCIGSGKLLGVYHCTLLSKSALVVVACISVVL